MVRKALRAADWILANAMRLILAMVSGMVICTMFIQLVSRYIFKSPIWGMDELTGHIAVWLYLMGAAYGTFERSHIKAEIVHLFIKRKTILLAIRTLASCVSVVVCLFMISWSYSYISWSIVRHEITPTLQIPAVLFQIPILISAVLMAIYFSKQTFELASQALDRQPVDE